MPPTRKLRVLFLDSTTFLKREMLNALRRRGDIQLFTAALPQRPSADQAGTIFEQVKQFLPSLVISLNEAGFDNEGRLFDLVMNTGAHVANWYYDDPRYDYLFWNRRPCPSERRIDFVTEGAWQTQLHELGYASHYLPLASDPAYFNADGGVAYERDVAFVGNSTLEFLDRLVTPELRDALERHAGLLAECRQMYRADPQRSVWQHLLSREESWADGLGVERRRFLFAMEWMVGYLYRRDFIVELASGLGRRFTCFGDAGWKQFIDPSQVSFDARYYDTLCRIYRSSRVNINLNRIHMPTSFTQRVFDCKASAAFLLAERRQMNERFFAVDGEARELVQFSSLPQCRELIDYYLANDDVRGRIAEAGRERVVALHTYDARVTSILDICASRWRW